MPNPHTPARIIKSDFDPEADRIELSEPDSDGDMPILFVTEGGVNSSTIYLSEDNRQALIEWLLRYTHV